MRNSDEEERKGTRSWCLRIPTEACRKNVCEEGDGGEVTLKLTGLQTTGKACEDLLWQKVI